jgi:hypothetical protein
LQALSYSQGSKTRYLVRLQLHEPTSCSLPALLQLKEGKAAAESAAAKTALADVPPVDAEHDGHAGAGSSHGSDESGAEPEDGAGGMAGNRKQHEEQEPL